MLIWLLLIFVATPLMELALLIELGRQIGLVSTLVIVIVTGILGASLAKAQGFHILRRMKQELSSGVFPADSLLDGAFVLAGGLLLLTPGLLTDMLGFFVLIPSTRQIIKKRLKKRIKSAIQTKVIRRDFNVDG